MILDGDFFSLIFFSHKFSQFSVYKSNSFIFVSQLFHTPNKFIYEDHKMRHDLRIERLKKVASFIWYKEGSIFLLEKFLEIVDNNCRYFNNLKTGVTCGAIVIFYSRATQLYSPRCPSVDWSVGRSISHIILFFAVFCLNALAQTL